MAGIYIHIPFCRKACNYCNFHFSTSLRLQDEVVGSIVKEAELQKDYLPDVVTSIYFGGGTPSILPQRDLGKILDQLRTHFAIHAAAEITLEANPDDLTREKLKEIREAGINRLSIGVQSFFDDDLIWMNRAHSALQAEECIINAQQAGLQNISIDLIYGTPTLTDADWQWNFEKAVSLGVQHLSCYALTVEPKTPLDQLIRKKRLTAVDPGKQAHQFELLMKWATYAGYEHYEISNFCLPGHRSRHNSSYWQSAPYLGLGPSAHSYNGVSRQWNVANNALYVRSIAQGIIPFEIEHLTEQQRFNEYIMTGLRTLEGVSLQRVEDDFGKHSYHRLVEGARVYLERKQLVVIDGSLKTTEAGKLLADGIASDLFVL